MVSLTESLGLVGDQPQQLREALRARLDRASQLYEAWSSGSYTDEEIGTMKSSHASLAREEMEAFLTPASSSSCADRRPPSEALASAARALSIEGPGLMRDGPTELQARGVVRGDVVAAEDA